MKKEITIKEYQDFTPKTFILNQEVALDYLITGLSAEVGEVAGVYAKYLRKDYDGIKCAELLTKEMGDCFYFLFQLANQIGVKVEDVLTANKIKLEDRLSRNVIQGNGDDR
jgi:NTP pyrophosphatase (non-canonical NTP hydrolase)